MRNVFFFMALLCSITLFAQRPYPHVVNGTWTAVGVPFRLDTVPVTQFELGWPDGDTLNPKAGQWSANQCVMCARLRTVDGNERCVGGTSYLYRIQNKTIDFFTTISDSGLKENFVYKVTYRYNSQTDFLTIYVNGKAYRYKRELLLANDE